MDDRNVQFPNRFRMVKVPGTDDIFDITPVPGNVYADGDFLNKLTLCTDDLCIALGLSTTATPTQAMEKLRQLVITAQNTAQAAVDNGVKIHTGSYVGTGTSGANNKNTITFPFTPMFFGVYGSGFSFNSAWGATLIAPHISGHNGNWYMSGLYEDNTVRWYYSNSANSEVQGNVGGSTYHYFAIG